MRVIVTGGRNWDRPLLIWKALDNAWLMKHMGSPYLVVVHGDASVGADRHARQWCEEPEVRAGGIPSLTIRQERHPATWRNPNTGRRDPAAGINRNSDMVGTGADQVLAFPGPCIKASCPRFGRHLSHGTTDCILKALRVSIPVKLWRPGYDLYSHEYLNKPEDFHDQLRPQGSSDPRLW